MRTSGFEARAGARPGAAVLELTGDVDAGAEEGLDAAYAAARASGESTLVLDFAGVGYINSTGIALLVGLLARARKDRVSVEAHRLSDHYREIFEITRLADFVRIVPGGDAG